MTETALVTGGTGFIARWCIVELLQRGYRVRATVRDASREAAVRDAISRVVDPADRLTCVAADRSRGRRRPRHRRYAHQGDDDARGPLGSASSPQVSSSGWPTSPRFFEN